jgi:glutathione S-transferase
MMKLYYSTTSPFVRKVNVFAIETGLDKQIELIKTNPWQAEDVLTAENPLSKVPTLITAEGMVIYDSRVICEYLDSLHDGEKLFPLNPKARWQALSLQALADGILEAGIARFLERKRDVALQSKDWDALQKKSVVRCLDNLEDTFVIWSVAKLSIGTISVACVLGWLDFRFSDEDWRVTRPDLAAWFEKFAARPSMTSTTPKE